MYVVFGASGQTGSAAADALLKKNLAVRVVLHSDKTVDVWRAKGADIAFADLGDVGAMSDAMRDADAVYALNPPAYNVADMVATAGEVGRHYVAAVEEAGARKVVLLSSVGSQHAEGTGNILTTHILEKIFDDLEVPVAFLRAASFMENWSGVAQVAGEKGTLPSFYAPLDRKLPMVSATDIGRAAAEAMTEEWTGRRIIELSGPADYSPNDVADAFADALGRDVRAIVLPESEWPAIISGFGFSPEAVNSYEEMMRGFNSGHIVFEGGSRVESRRGETTIKDAVGRMTGER